MWYADLTIKKGINRKKYDMDISILKTKKISLVDISRELCQRQLSKFFRQSWDIIEPTKQLKWNWHIDAISAHLEAVHAGQINRLIINIPPGCLKSSLVSVAFPAWSWILKPSLRMLTSSGAMSLATRDCLRSRRIIESAWYKQRWNERYQLTSDQNTKTRYDNDKTGCRVALSTGSATTGERGDLLICDDPHDARDALAISGKTMDAQCEWFEQIFSTRCNSGGAMIIVMQRLSDNDVVGRELKKGGWEHLCLPMEFEPHRKTITSIGFSDPREKEGELLQPIEYDDSFIARQKIALGSFGYAGQYQQRPSPREGGIIKRDWWRFYRELPHGWERMVMQSWDTAYTSGGDNWAMISAAWIDGRLWLLPNGYFKKSMDTPDGERMVNTLYRRDNPYIVLIEKKASGQSIIQNIQRTGWMPVKAVNVSASKEQRAQLASPKIEAGLIMLPDPEVYPEARWVADLIESCAAFPAAGVHDDDVDALTQLINYIWSIPHAGVRLLSDDSPSVKIEESESVMEGMYDDDDEF